MATLAAVEGIRRLRLPGIMAADVFSPTARFDVWGGEVYIGDTLRPTIEVVDSYGGHVRSITWEASVLAPSDALDQVREVLQKRVNGNPTQDELLDAPLPDRIPAFTDFLVDSRGLVWIRPYVPSRDAVVLGGTPALHRTNPGGDWLVFGRNGEQIAVVGLPPDPEPYQITSQDIVGIARDSLGVETVRVHALVREKF